MRKTKEESDNTREAILDAAVKIFSCKGVSSTSLSEIASEAGVTRGAIYWHFNNKMDIFDALHERLYKPISEIIVGHLDKAENDPLGKLQELCVSLLQELDRSPHQKQALMLFWVKCDYSGDLEVYREKHNCRKKESGKMFAHYLNLALEKGLLPASSDPDILYISIGCYMKGIIIEYLKNPDMIDLQKQAPALIEQFFRGLK